MTTVNVSAAQGLNIKLSAITAEKYLIVKKSGVSKLVWANPRIFLKGPVDYSVYGSPTIENNVLRGISQDNIVSTASAFATDGKDFRMRFRVKKTANKTFLPVFCLSVQQNTYVGFSGNGAAAYFKIAGNTVVELTNFSTFPNGEWGLNYEIIVVLSRTYDSTTFNYELKVSADNGTSWNSATGSYVTDPFTSRQITFLRTPAGSGAGVTLLYLEDTMIELDGSLWFYGKVYSSPTALPVYNGFSLGSQTITSNGIINPITQTFTAISGATWGNDEVSEES